MISRNASTADTASPASSPPAVSPAARAASTAPSPPGVGAAYTDAEGARLQVDHLAERGHTRLGIAIPKSTYLMEYAARRIRGIIERLGLEVASPAEAREILRLKGLDKVAF